MRNSLIFILLFLVSCLNAVSLDFTNKNYIFFLNQTKIPNNEIDIRFYDESGNSLEWSRMKNTEELQKSVIDKYFKNINVKPEIYKRLDIICIEFPENAQTFNILPLSKYVGYFESRSQIRRGFLYTLELKQSMRFLDKVCENGEAQSVYYSLTTPNGILKFESVEKVKLTFKVRTAPVEQLMANLSLDAAAKAKV